MTIPGMATTVQRIVDTMANGMVLSMSQMEYTNDIVPPPILKDHTDIYNYQEELKVTQNMLLEKEQQKAATLKEAAEKQREEELKRIWLKAKIKPQDEV